MTAAPDDPMRPDNVLDSVFSDDGPLPPRGSAFVCSPL